MRALIVVLVSLGFATPAVAGCFQCLPPGFFGCGPRLGLGPGYPGLFPPTYVCPPWVGYGWVPEERVIVVPSAPVQVFVSEERAPAARPPDLEVAHPTQSADELARARRLYPNGVPAVQHVWLQGKAVITLHEPASTPERR